MRLIVQILIMISMLIMVGCGGSSSTSSNTSAPVADDPITGEIEPAVMLSSPLTTTDKQKLIIMIKSRSTEDGAVYEFDSMDAVFTEQPDSVEVTFRYSSPNNKGGAPVAVVARESGEILSINYTR